jgi:hypothetical protein
MSVPDIIFLTAVCMAFGVFMITVGAAAWMCRDSLISSDEPALRPAVARARSKQPPR